MFSSRDLRVFIETVPIILHVWYDTRGNHETFNVTSQDELTAIVTSSI